MLPYIIFISFIILFYIKRWPKCILWTLIIFAALRYNVGWDYASYVGVVNTPSEWDNAETSRFSFIWRELFRFAYLLDSPHLAIIIPNIATYVCVYLSLRKLNLSQGSIADALFVYATWNYLYLESFSIIRQAFATSVGLLMFTFIQNRKYIKSCLCYIFAILLHPSAAILIIIWPIYYFRSKINFYLLSASIFSIFFALFSLKSILQILSFLGDAYEIYLSMNDSFGGKIVIVNAFLTIYLLAVFFNSKNMNYLKRQCYFFTIFSFSGNVAVHILGLPGVIGRTFLYFGIFVIMILLDSTKRFRYKFHFRLIASIILVLYFFTYLLITRSGGALASSDYLPYKCILFN